jgi:uncharacterized protein YbcI
MGLDSKAPWRTALPVWRPPPLTTETSNQKPVDGGVRGRISNAIVALFREYYGRGPTRAKTYIVDDYVLTVLEDTMTTVEETLARQGRQELVREVRVAFQNEMADSFRGAVEELTGRKVIAYHSQIVFDPDMGFEIFVLEPEEDGSRHAGPAQSSSSDGGPPS